MKTIVFENHPVIDKLRRHKLGVVGFEVESIPTILPLMPWLEELWQEHSPHFAKAIRAIPKSVYERLTQSIPHLLTAPNILSISPQSGSMICEGMLAICYHLFGDTDETSSEVFFVFEGEVLLAAYENNMLINRRLGFCSASVLESRSSRHLSWSEQQMAQLFAWTLFLAQTPLERAVIAAGDKKTLNGQAYHNQANLAVEFIELSNRFFFSMN